SKPCLGIELRLDFRIHSSHVPRSQNSQTFFRHHRQRLLHLFFSLSFLDFSLSSLSTLISLPLPPSHQLSSLSFSIGICNLDCLVVWSLYFGFFSHQSSLRGSSASRNTVKIYLLHCQPRHQLPASLLSSNERGRPLRS
ncbi:hypothetical protein F4677DRAFT_463324, partial [Hypoxylon crocopeplum]